MIILKSKYTKLFLAMLSIGLVACSSPWDDREDVTDSNLNQNLNQAIAETAETSEFAKLIVKSGYDKTLEASKSYTVFAPTNQAIAQVDPAVLNDAELLKQFVANHITINAYSSVRNTAKDRLQMLGEKYLNFEGSSKIGDAQIVSPDHYAKNGIFHVVNKALAPKLNIWEYVNAKQGSSAMSAYLVSLNDKNIYPEDQEAKESAEAGMYADSLSNSYLKNVYNVNNEKNEYTFFMMENEGYNAEVAKMTPYLTKSNADSTATYASYFTLRDLTLPKVYTKEQLNDSITSRFGVKYKIDKTQIVGEPIQLSNGVLYVMKKVEVALKDRLVTTKIEGEANYGYISSDPDLGYKILYRDKKDPSGVLFNDAAAYELDKTPMFTMYYRAKDLYSTTYKVYWRAINDFGSDFQQQLRISNIVSVVGNTTTVNVIKEFPYTQVARNFYQEVYLGEFTHEQAGEINRIALIGANNGTKGANAITLDYLKFVPVIKK